MRKALPELDSVVKEACLHVRQQLALDSKLGQRILRKRVILGRWFGIVYLLTFSSGKSYVGITSAGIEQRFVNHVKTAFRGKGGAVHNAIRKYGLPKIKVLKIVPKTTLKQAEQEAVFNFKCLSPGGYNMTPGGDFNPMYVPEIAARHKEIMAGPNGPMHRPEVKEKLRLSLPARMAKMIITNTGKKRSEKTKAKMRVNHWARRYPELVKERRGEGNPMWGRNHTIEARKKISIAHKGTVASAETRAKMSLASKGKKKSPEHRAKLAAVLKLNRWIYGNTSRRKGNVSLGLHS